MSTLLHVITSPRGAASESTALAETFLSVVRDEHRVTEIDTLDLWKAALPVFGPTGASAKLTVFAGGELDGQQSEVWARAQALADQFAAADRYVFGVPMWNAGVPYVLKQWIDIITQPGMLFGFDPTSGYRGLLEGKKAAVMYTGGVYAPGAPIEFGADFHSTFFNDWLRFVGVDDVVEVRFQPTILTADPAADREAAHERARVVARSF